jgi:hypothetical protein
MHKKLYHLAGPDIIELRRTKLLSKLPYVTLDEINDKSKSDGFVRVISIVQILWVTILILIRALRHLAVSQLEISVVAFSPCAVIIYFLNWEKPKGPQTPITILSYSGEIPNNILEKLRILSGSESKGNLAGNAERLKLLTSFSTQDFRSGKLGLPIPNYCTRNQGGGEIGGLFLGSVVFGGIHLAAWKSEFPSKPEQIMWQVASLLCTLIFILWVLWACFLTVVGPILMGMCCIMCIKLPMFSEDSEKLAGISLILFLCLVLVLPLASYVLARLFLLVEIFRTLRFLPPSAYTSTWASSIPHVS